MNKIDVYKNEIFPLVKNLQRSCYENGIPMFFAAAVKDDGNTTTYKHEMVSSVVAKQPLTDDRIAKFVNVTMGYDVVMPNQQIEIDFGSDSILSEEYYDDEEEGECENKE